MIGKAQLLRGTLFAASLLVPQISIAQLRLDPQANGELNIEIWPSGTIRTIRVEAVGDVWGSKNDLPPYPVTHEYDLTQVVGNELTLNHVDDSGAGDPYIIGYGRYKITIVEDGKSTYVDFRDCNYTNPAYYNPPAADMWVDYNADTGTFTLTPQSGNVWDLSLDPSQRRTSCFLKVKIKGHGHQG
jgi:hypothetical protein